MAISSKDVAKKRYLAYLYKQYEKGTLNRTQVEFLRREGYIKEGPTIVKMTPSQQITQKKVKRWSNDPFVHSGTFSRFKDHITKEDWLPESNLYHKQDFIDWINSIVYGPFPQAINYPKFERYKAQAFRWLQEKDNITNYKDDDAKREYANQERDRIKENTLYFANKYGELKEGDAASGMMKYTAKEHHAVIFYLFDCRYNVVGGKGRQIGFTSAMGLIALKMMVIQNNYYIKFIAEDKDTVEEIFTDKLKYPFGALPRWLQPPVKSDSGQRFWLSDKPGKGKKGYPNSRCDVVAPKKTAINGGSPQLALIDEIGNIGILGPMLNEARPTMFWNDPITGKFALRRQIWMWGTGGEMDRGKGAYEKEWYRILGLWEAKQFEGGFVPLFFSWHARLNKEEYEKEKSWYYGARASERDIDLETSKIQFHQHYPTSFKDMFLSNSSTLVSREIIEGGQDRCRALGPRAKPTFGYFEPVYDYNDPMPPESDVPYRVIDARFIPLDDDDPDQMGTTWIFQHPEKFYVNRYWQGTDPVSTESGHSKQASAIWDDYMKTCSALVNFRKSHEHKYGFLQTVLLGLYYDVENVVKRGVKELVEANIGTNYIDYKESKGFLQSLIFNQQLPAKVQGGARDIGLDKKGLRSDAVVEYMTEVFRNYHHNIYISVFFDQLTTFAYTLTQAGKESWGPLNKFMHYDDALDAITYAYIGRIACSHMKTHRIDGIVSRNRVRYKLVRDANWNLVRTAVKEKSNTFEDERKENIRSSQDPARRLSQSLPGAKED